jgi:hypothetical protein
MGSLRVSYPVQRGKVDDFDLFINPVKSSRYYYLVAYYIEKI